MAEEGQKLNEYGHLKAYCEKLQCELKDAKEEINRLQGVLLNLTNGWLDKETALQQDVTSASEEDAEDQLSEEVDMEYCPISTSASKEDPEDQLSEEVDMEYCPISPAEYSESYG